jgi:hypothetical protein
MRAMCILLHDDDDYHDQHDLEHNNYDQYRGTNDD